MSLRRPMLIRWQAYMEESLLILEKSPEAAPSDLWLCHLVQAQHIAEEVGFQFSMDDPTSMISLADNKTQYHLRAFERQLDEWRDRANGHPELDNPNVRFTDAIISLFTHEIAMHHNHNIDDFKPPYLGKGPAEASPEPDFITPFHIEALTNCLQSIHKAFDSFLEFGVEGLRTLPTLIFVRNSYAAVALIKMHSAVSGSGPAGKYGSIFKKDDLRVEEYLDKLINLMTAANEPEGTCRVAGKFAFILGMLEKWHQRRKEGRRTLEKAAEGPQQQQLQQSQHQDQTSVPTSAPSRQWTHDGIAQSHIHSQMQPFDQQFPPQPPARRSNSHPLQVLSEAASSNPMSGAGTPKPQHQIPPQSQPYSYMGPSGPYVPSLGPPGTAAGPIDPNLMNMGGYGTGTDLDFQSLMDDSDWLRLSNASGGMMDFAGMMDDVMPITGQPMYPG
ncbi:MAG: hypothetical protein Q9227_000197 [Pyrenula ochraceoflavens]